MIRKNITSKDLNNLRLLKSTLSKISRARGTPERLRVFTLNLIKKIDKILSDEKVHDRLRLYNTILEIIVKISSIIQLFK